MRKGRLLYSESQYGWKVPYRRDAAALIKALRRFSSEAFRGRDWSHEYRGLQLYAQRIPPRDDGEALANPGVWRVFQV
jgi:hypothetical protein